MNGPRKNNFTFSMGSAMKANFIKTVFFLILCTALLLTGCSKVTKENYDKLKVGQDYNDVVEILGKVDTCSGTMGIQDCRWGEDSKYISVKFAGRKVINISAKGL
jgi:hypothetical protein